MIWRVAVLPICAALALQLATGCSGMRLRPASAVDSAALPAAPTPGPNPAWSLPPAEVEQILLRERLEVTERHGAGGGVTGASKLRLSVPGRDVELAVKWKTVPASLDGWNNSPRKELAAYQVQKLFLDANDYVVPPTVMRCLPADSFGEWNTRAEPTIEGSSCVLGTMALWLRNVRPVDRLFDAERFSRDPNYAYHLANLNVLTFLIAHKDGRSSNFLVSVDDSDRRVFAIDNGIAFDPWLFNYLVPNWHRIRVPAVSNAAIVRLRGLSDAELARLAVVAELEMGEDGIFRDTEPDVPIDSDRGVRRGPGRVQFGLTTGEIADLGARIAELVEWVDSGALPVF